MVSDGNVAFLKCLTFQIQRCTNDDEFSFFLQKHTFAKVQEGESWCFERFRKCGLVKTVTGDITDSFAPQSSSSGSSLLWKCVCTALQLQHLWPRLFISKASMKHLRHACLRIDLCYAACCQSRDQRNFFFRFCLHNLVFEGCSSVLQQSGWSLGMQSAQQHELQQGTLESFLQEVCSISGWSPGCVLQHGRKRGVVLQWKGNLWLELYIEICTFSYRASPSVCQTQMFLMPSLRWKSTCSAMHSLRMPFSSPSGSGKGSGHFCRQCPQTSSPVSVPRTSAVRPTKLCKYGQENFRTPQLWFLAWSFWSKSMSIHPKMWSLLIQLRVETLSRQDQLMEEEQKWSIFAYFIYPFLSRDDLSGTWRNVAWTPKLSSLL